MSLFTLFKKTTTATPAATQDAALVPDAIPQGPLTYQDIARFLPIRLLPRRVMDYLAKHSTTSAYRSGVCIPKPVQGQETLYLLSGTLEFRMNGAYIRRIDSKDAKSTFPIAFAKEDGEEVLVIKDAQLVHFPNELIAGVEKISADGKHWGSVPIDTGINPGVFDELLEKARAGRLELPSAPDLGVRISRAIDNPDTSIEEVARIIQLDPALTARLIQVSNSPLYSGLDKTKNCSMAVTRMGLDTTRNLVVSFLLKNLFTSNSRVLQKAMDQVWTQSTKVAAISSVLAKVTPRLDSGRALLAGLVHRIGAIGVINSAKSHPELLEDPDTLNDAIIQLGPPIGAIMLEQWNFGDDLVDVILNSADWMRDENNTASYTDLVMIARLHAAIGTPMMRQLPRMDLVPAFHKLALGRLSPTLSSAILEEADKSIHEVQALLN